MSLPVVFLIAALAAAPSDEAVRLASLIHPVGLAAKPAKAAPARAPAKPDPAAELIGHKVRVRTVDRGLYAGILQSIDANAVVLRIELREQAISYTLPRHGVTVVESAETTP